VIIELSLVICQCRKICSLPLAFRVRLCLAKANLPQSRRIVHEPKLQSRKLSVCTYSRRRCRGVANAAQTISSWYTRSAEPPYGRKAICSSRLPPQTPVLTLMCLEWRSAEVQGGCSACNHG